MAALNTLELTRKNVRSKYPGKHLRPDKYDK